MEETFLDKAKKHLKKYGKYYAGAAALAGTAYGVNKYKKTKNKKTAVHSPDTTPTRYETDEQKESNVAFKKGYKKYLVKRQEEDLQKGIFKHPNEYRKNDEVWTDWRKKNIEQKAYGVPDLKTDGKTYVRDYVYAGFGEKNIKPGTYYKIIGDKKDK